MTVPAEPKVDPTHPDLSAANEGATNRLNEAMPQAPAPGDGPAQPPAAPPAGAPPAGDEPFDFFDENAVMPGFENMPYREGKKLEGEIRKARETFKPLRDAFGELDDNARAALLEAAPVVGDDLVFLANVGARLHVDDRRWFLDAMNLMATDPRKAAEMLRDGSAQIAQGFAAADPGTLPGQTPPTEPAPGWAQPPDGGQQQQQFAPDDPNRPMTRGEWEQAQKERDDAAEVAGWEQEILRQARELGYDPDSTEPADHMRLSSLIEMAGRPESGGDLGKAHELVQQYEQSVIDKFVQGKAADADRPGVPVGGAAPAERRVLETNQDAQEAVRNRLDATLGPDPNRRGSED